MNNQLKLQLENIFNTVLTNVTIKVLEELRSIIYDYVYTPIDDNNTMYERTYEFPEAYIARVTERLVKEIYFEPNYLTYDPTKYQHGNSSVDRRNMMAEILNNDSVNYDNADFGGAKNIELHNEGYWDAFFNYLETNIDKLIIQEFKKQGLNVKKVR